MHKHSYGQGLRYSATCERHRASSDLRIGPLSDRGCGRRSGGARGASRRLDGGVCGWWKSHVVLGRPSLISLATDPARWRARPRSHAPGPRVSEFGSRPGAASRRQLRSDAVSRRKRSRRNTPDVRECPRPGLLIARALSSHRGGQGFKSPQLHANPHVSALTCGHVGSCRSGLPDSGSGGVRFWEPLEALLVMTTGTSL